MLLRGTESLATISPLASEAETKRSAASAALRLVLLCLMFQIEADESENCQVSKLKAFFFFFFSSFLLLFLSLCVNFCLSLYFIWVYGDHSMGIVLLLTCVRGFSLAFSSVFLVFAPVEMFFDLLQVLGQLHGGCPWWFHERQPSQWHAHHYPSQEVHGTHTHYLSPG